MTLSLSCPNCGMVVNVLEGFATERKLCPSCQSEMSAVEETEVEAVVAEAADATAMVAVELGTDAAPARPTIVVPHAEPPKWKATPVAQAWTTVARGLVLQRWGVLVALAQPIATMVVLVMSWFNVARLEATDDGYPPAAWVVFFLSIAVIGVSGALFVAGRLCCYRVPPRTGARVWMGIACASMAVAVLIALVTSSAYSVGPGIQVSSVLRAGQWVALGFWLASEWSFLWAVGRIGHFVKRHVLVRLTCGAAVAAVLVAGLWVWLTLRDTNGLLLLFEIALAGLFVLYLFLLRATQDAVQTKTPDESAG